MQELNPQEVEMVNGGILITLTLLALGKLLCNTTGGTGGSGTNITTNMSTGINSLFNGFLKIFGVQQC